MLLHDPEGNGEAQTCSSQIPAPGLVGAIETFKDSGLILRGNADTGVDHLEHGLVASFLQRETDSSRHECVFNRVVEQDIQQLVQCGLVARDSQAPAADSFGKSQRPKAGHGAPLSRGSHYHLPKVDGADFQRLAARVRARQRQEFFNHG